MSKICVIGDNIIDQYIYGQTIKLNPEGPMPLVSVDYTECRDGGASNVANNLYSLGLEPYHLIAGCTSTKTRLFSNNHYLVRYDQDVYTDPDVALSVILEKDFSQFEYVVLSDYNKGTLSKTQEIINHINSFGCKIIADIKRPAEHYQGVWMIKGNEKEAIEYGIWDWDGNSIITSSSVNYLKFNNEFSFTAVKQVEVNDVTGAGDCFIAVFTYALIMGRSPHVAMVMATRAATMSVQHHGTYVVSKDDIKNIDVSVFVNGCFDLLHEGHIHLLTNARKVGTRVIAAINSDESVKRLKGDSRPIDNESTRRQKLLETGLVDEVYIFDDDTPYNLIKHLSPDIIMKGSDYKEEAVVGKNLAKVMIVDNIPGVSTTSIIEKGN